MDDDWATEAVFKFTNFVEFYNNKYSYLLFQLLRQQLGRVTRLVSLRPSLPP